MCLHFLINWAVKGKALFTGQRHENFIFDLKNYFFYLEIVNRFSKYDFFTSPIYCIYSIHYSLTFQRYLKIIFAHIIFNILN